MTKRAEEDIQKRIFHSKESVASSIEKIKKEVGKDWCVQNYELRELFSEDGTSHYIIPSINFEETRKIVIRNDRDVYKEISPFKDVNNPLDLVFINKTLFDAENKYYDSPEEFIWSLLHPEQKFSVKAWNKELDKRICAYLRGLSPVEKKEAYADFLSITRYYVEDVDEEKEEMTLYTLNNFLALTDEEQSEYLISRFRLLDFWYDATLISPVFSQIENELNERYLIFPLWYEDYYGEALGIELSELNFDMYFDFGFLNPLDALTEKYEGIIVADKSDPGTRQYIDNPELLDQVTTDLWHFVNNDWWKISFKIHNEDGKMETVFSDYGYGEHPDDVLLNYSTKNVRNEIVKDFTTILEANKYILEY